MSDDVKNESPDAADGANALRRRLMKASLAAPMAATLAPNSALALSSAVQCAQQASDFEPAVRVGNEDGAMRRRVRVFVKKPDKPAHLPQYVLRVDDKLYTRHGDQIDTNRFRQVKDNYSKEHADVLEMFMVDREGISEQGTWPAFKPHGATPLSVSCWTSINPDSVTRHNI